MKPKISVITATLKPGYIDTMAQALEQQTFSIKDFEWIIVDDLYEKRKGAVETFLDMTELKYTHVPPRELKPHFACASSWNTCLIYATGELVYFMNDYEYPMPLVLERHWYVYKKYGPLHNNRILITGGVSSTYSDFVEDEIDIFNPRPVHYISVLTRPFVVRQFRKPRFNGMLKKEVEKDIHLWKPHGWRGWWAGRNDSCTLETCLDINGFNEIFDGSWGGQDVDFQERAEEAYGCVYYVDTKVDNTSLELPNPFHGSKPKIWSSEERDKFVFERIRDPLTRGSKKFYKSVNNWDIREERRRLGID